MKKDAAIYTVSAILGSALMIPMALFLARILQPADFGKAMLFITVTNLLFFICNIGMDQVFTRFFYEKHSHQDKLTLLMTALLVFTCMFLILFVVLFPFRHPILNYLFQDSRTFIIILLALGGYLFGIQRFFLLSLRMAQKSLLYGLGKVLSQLFLLVSVVLIYYIFHVDTFLLSAYAEVFAIAVGIVVLFFCLLFLAKQKKVSAKLAVDYASLSHYLAYGYPFIFSLSLFWLSENIDKFALLHWSSFHELGIYTAAFVLATPLVFVKGIFTTMWVPIRNKAICGDLLQAKKIFSTVFNNAYLYLSLLMMCVILLKGIIGLVLPESYQNAIAVFPWLLFIPYFWSLSEIVTSGLVLTKKTYWNIFISIVCVLVNVLACYLFIPALGAKGAAISIALTYFVFFVLKVLIAFRFLDFKLPYLNMLVSWCFLVAMILVENPYIMLLLALCLIAVLLKFPRKT